MDSVLYKKTENVKEETGFLYHHAYNSIEPAKLHHHDYYEIFLTVSGETIHTVNGSTYRLPEGSLVLIRPRDSHGYTSIGQERYSFVNLAFYEETMESLFQYLSDCLDTEELASAAQPPMVRLSKTEKNNLLASLDKLNAADMDDPGRRTLRFKRILVEIFTRFFASAFREEPSAPAWLENAVQEIKKPENFIEGMERFRQLCGKSTEHICRCMQARYGQSPTEFINEIRLNYAANMLLSTNKSTSEICYACGFENISWFYSCFRKKYGITPGSFRKRFRTAEKI